jgi:peroxiredoxin
MHNVAVLFFLVFGLSPNSAQIHQNKKTDITSKPSFDYEISLQGTRLKMNFSHNLKSISKPDILFSHFSNKKLIIFYFSVKCMHCQKVLSEVQELSKNMEQNGVVTIAIAVKNNTADDIRTFIRNNNFSMPVFHDTEKVFSSQYGTGRIPLVITIKENGEYIRFKNFDTSTPPHIESVFTSH